GEPVAEARDTVDVDDELVALLDARKMRPAPGGQRHRLGGTIGGARAGAYPDTGGGGAGGEEDLEGAVGVSALPQNRPRRRAWRALDGQPGRDGEVRVARPEPPLVDAPRERSLAEHECGTGSAGTPRRILKAQLARGDGVLVDGAAAPVQRPARG